MAQFFVEPASITRAAEAGATLRRGFEVKFVPQGSLVASVSGGDSMIRLTDLIAYELQRKEWTDDELADLPPDLREQARQEGYTDKVEVGRVSAGEPLFVHPGLHVQGMLEFTAGVPGPRSVTGTLVVESSGERVDVPLVFVIGGVRVEFLVDPVVGVRNDEVAVPVRVSLSGGAPTNDIVLGSADPWIDVPDHTVSVPESGSVTTTLRLQVWQFAPLGPLPANLWVKGFFDHVEVVPYKVTVVASAQSVVASQRIQEKVAVLGEGPPGARTPVSEVEAAGGGGFVQRYTTGNVYWHADTGAKWVYGAVVTKYLQLDGPAGLLGFPVADEVATAGDGGRMSAFQGGSIYFSTRSGACEVHGKILDHWRARGAETSYLGFPTLDQQGNMSRFERGTVQLQDGEFSFDVSDARDIKTGVVHVDGAAANGWAELMVSSTGGWQYKGSMRSTGVLSYDVLMVVTMDLRPFGGPVLTFAEDGDVEGTLVFGGNRAHTWDQFGMDDRVKDNFELIRGVRWSAAFTVDFGPGDLLAVVASVVGVPLAAIAMFFGGAFFGENVKVCGRYGHMYYDPVAGESSEERGVVFVPKGEPCPPGTFC
ncbi:LGFP repeat-containing protein [Umezawaea beigongshangensis]|uniref:LGFP repeat-containing protein n=1 Tax=Umezawaea beigongshangensis TaxID=2780383 RepID=UPI0018F2115C|nr:hypothetical protein [Umezawaea beigongshangensis]